LKREKGQLFRQLTWGRGVVMCVVGKEPRRVTEKSRVWVIGIQRRVRRAKTVKGVWNTKERHRADGCPDKDSVHEPT
jgi:hypothetical protein